MGLSVVPTDLVGAGLLAMQAPRSSRDPASMPSSASRLPRWLPVTTCRWSQAGWAWPSPASRRFS
ncbi:hypothetical protein CCU68_07025 [Pseudomonas gingeri NCPPB 3146 = LMG 5327]|uniref:LysR family transcriptional regulator n=1 Tax=Pseudomonas gingeri NCPPB 3146 = LMG 5327 TaxID=707248 RepID=A0ABX4Y8G9_9PSED|nr:hypothetical protein CCU68_07025 [Pseudomonas gingeri NCPPB 3146 = LMG 5327]